MYTETVELTPVMSVHVRNCKKDNTFYKSLTFLDDVVLLPQTKRVQI